MGKIAWYKRDPVAALDGMRVLSLEERGAYNTILDLIYSRDGNLPDDDRFLCGWLGVDLRVWKRIKARLIALGKLYIRDGLLGNARADAVVHDALAKVVATAQAGRSKGRKSCAVPLKDNDLDGADDRQTKIKIENKKEEEPSTAETPTPSEAETAPETVVEPEPPSPTAPAPAEGKTKTKPSPEPRGTRLPATGWKLTPEMAQHARDNGLTDDEIRAEALKFRDHWLGVPGAKGRKADWPATWRNWCRNAMEWRPARPSGQQPRAAPIDPRLAARIAESKARADAISSAEAAGLNPLDEAFDRHVGALMMEWYNNAQRRSA